MAVGATMRYRALGSTGIRVSAIGLGTVSLGLDYGIAASGQFGRPTSADAIRLLREAFDGGINLFDTAPGYGDSERLIGEALGPVDGLYVATKVSVPRDKAGAALRGDPLHKAIELSLADSRQALRREVLDIVQIHNADVESLAQGEMAECLLDARREGIVRLIGASVYGEEAAMAVIRAGCFDVLQIAYSVLDQRMAPKVIPAAAGKGMAVIVRSALLKGVLTAKAPWLPPELGALAAAASKAREALARSDQQLPEMALRFCLSVPGVSTVLIGARTSSELAPALAAAQAGPLPTDLLAQTPALALTEERLLNPSYWPVS